VLSLLAGRRAEEKDRRAPIKRALNDGYMHDTRLINYNKRYIIHLLGFKFYIDFVRAKLESTKELYIRKGRRKEKEGFPERIRVGKEGARREAWALLLFKGTITTKGPSWPNKGPILRWGFMQLGKPY